MLDFTQIVKKLLSKGRMFSKLCLSPSIITNIYFIKQGRENIISKMSDGICYVSKQQP